MKIKSTLDRIDVPFEIKGFHDDDEDFFVFEGFASTFGNLDLVDDIVMPGAFRESIEKQFPVILWQHNPHEPIGVPLELRENEQGLFLKAKLPKNDSFVSGRVAPQLRIGSIKAMSIGFRVLDEEFDEDNPRIRRIKKVHLAEISLVTFPANPQAAITSVKTIDDINNIKTVREFEKALRDAGFSKSAAETAASSKFNESLRGEPVSDEIDLKNALASITKTLSQRSIANEISKISLEVIPHVRHNSSGRSKEIKRDHQ